MTAEQRASIDNGIHLCTRCATIIDKDESEYPVTLLRGWKASHEEFIAGGAAHVPPPWVQVTTLEGLSFPPSEGGGSIEITHEMQEAIRECRLLVENRSVDSEVLSIEMRVQLPEGAITGWELSCPAATQVEIRRDQMDIQVHGSVKVQGGLPPPTELVISLSSLLPGESVEWVLWTRLDFIPQVMQFGSEPLSITGSYLFRFHNGFVRSRFTVPLTYEAESRTLTSSEPRVLREGERVRRRISWP